MKTIPITKRKSFGKVKSRVEIPNLVEVQLHSYEQFLQADIPPSKRKPIGLQSAFIDSFPITDIYEKYELQFDSYFFKKPRFTVDECRTRNLTYSMPLYVRLRLIYYDEKSKKGAKKKKVKEIKESTVYLGDLPQITPYGTFVINGSERVVVTQLHRSPGVFFDEKIHPNGKRLFSARLIPLHGSWMELTYNVRDVLQVVISSRKKVPYTTLLRAMGYETDREIIQLFYQVEKVKLTGKNAKSPQGAYCAENVVHPETGEIILEIGTLIQENDVNRLKDNKIKTVDVVFPDSPTMVPVIFNTLKADKTTNKLEAVQEVYSGIRPGDVVEEGNEDIIMEEYFFNIRRFDLGVVGRYKLNQRLNRNVPVDQRTMLPEDFVEIGRYLLDLRHNRGFIDDIDHLGVRRARAVGELVENQIRIGLSRMARTVRERMRTKDVENLSAGDLVNARTVVAVINTFFGSSQLSQFMDQTNPLAELTHKRRLSALGPGGLSRERAGFEVRDVHYTHYGRMCPIETPEGQNIGLITSLATYAKLNDYGFLETPFIVVKNGKVTDKIVYITADEEDRHTIVEATTPIDKNGKITANPVIARRRGDLIEVSPDEVDLMDVSPEQLVSISAALIPFLEHDDASRALMGSNMQRQSVPLLFTEAPRIGTGLEHKAAVDSGAVIVAKRDGTVSYVDAKTIHITVSDPKTKLIDDKDVYNLVKFRRSNQNTTINQRPLVKVGEKIKAGQIIADGPATKNGELSLGKNIKVAFMSWHGYNFEDAIIISERLVKDDTFTSLHIENFETQVRETKLGAEELTREIPNVSDEMVKDLDERGIVRVGAHIRSGDILCGKVTPKGETELTPELRLLKAIFGEKAGDVKDSSLTVPPGIQGVVIDTLLLSRKGYRRTGKAEREQIKALDKKYSDLISRIKSRRDKKIRELLIGNRAQNIISEKTGEPIIPPGQKITKKKAEKINIDNVSADSTWTDKDSANIKIQQVLKKASDLINIKKEEHNQEKQKLIRGDELPAGVVHLAKVDVAMKRKISVGDKMAGRHGNKGVISIIVPEEDMPYMEDGTPVD
ncbi:DNA-directed RNA polymerase subunit beta, partial [bacterium]